MVEFAARLAAGDVAEEIGFELQGQRACAENASLQPDAQDGFGTHAPFAQKRVSIGRINHLAAPGRHSPGMGMPVRNWREHGRTGHFSAAGCLWFAALSRDLVR